MDDEDGDKGKDKTEAKTMESDEGIVRPDLAVTVTVEEIAVLLQDGAVGVAARIIISSGARKVFV